MNECGENTCINPFETSLEPDIKERNFIFDSEIDNLRNFKPVDIKITGSTMLSKGIYKISYNIPEVLENKHYTNITKAIPVNNEYKDIIFHKVDVMPFEDGSGSVVTTIFEIVTNPILVSVIIGTIATAIIGAAGSFLITSAQKLVNSITKMIPWAIALLMTFWLIFRK